MNNMDQQEQFPDKLPNDGSSTHNGSDGSLIDRRANHFPKIFRGTAAPATTPEVVGDIFVDTTNKKVYFATGIASSSDWTVVN